MQRASSSEKTLMLGKSEGKRRRGSREWEDKKQHRLTGHEFQQTRAESERQRSLACCQSVGSQRVRYDVVTEQQWHPSILSIRILRLERENDFTGPMQPESRSLQGLDSRLFLQISAIPHYVNLYLTQITGKDLVHNSIQRQLQVNHPSLTRTIPPLEDQGSSKEKVENWIYLI